MKAWELTEDEIKTTTPYGLISYMPDYKAVAKAAQRKLVEWLENNDDMNIELMSRKALEEWQQLKEDLEE